MCLVFLYLVEICVNVADISSDIVCGLCAVVEQCFSDTVGISNIFLCHGV